MLSLYLTGHVGIILDATPSASEAPACATNPSEEKLRRQTNHSLAPVMPGLTLSIARTSRTILRPYSSYNEYATLSSVDSIVGTFAAVDLTEFRKRAFLPEKPLHITTKTRAAEKAERAIWLDQLLPAARKWFSHEPENAKDRVFALSEPYLSRFQDTILPYELIIDPNGDALQRYINWAETANNGSQELATFLANCSPSRIVAPSTAFTHLSLSSYKPAKQLLRT